MAYIRRLATSGKWQAQIERNGAKSSKTFETKREAQAWALEREALAKREKAGKGWTFGDALDKYIQDVSSKKRGEVWEVRRLQAVRDFFGSDSGLIEIDSPQIAAWRDSRLKQVSASTVVREANLLRNVFSVARTEWRWLEHDPFRGVKMPKENAPRTAMWGWRLIRRVLRAERTGKTREMQDAFHIALRTGMRLGEVLAAPAAFDAKARVVTIRTKTEAVARIPIGRIAAKLLDRPAFTVGANEGSVLFSKLCRELLIEGLTFHDSRGTALTHLSRKVDVLTLARVSRHRDLKILMSVYYRESAENIALKI